MTHTLRRLPSPLKVKTSPPNNEPLTIEPPNTFYMGSRLFSVPLEIRQQIYLLSFGLEELPATITPDPERTRRDSSYEANATVNGNLALLCTSQQVHNEITELLYGSNTFYFSDHRHGNGDHRIEASAHCGFCTKYREKRDSGDLSDDFWDRCWSSVDDKHWIGVPLCDFTSLHTWLRNIGPRNRALIKTMHFHFTTAQFTKVLGMSFPNGTWDRKPCPVGGDDLVQALRILALGHNLKTLRISFDAPKHEHESDVRASVQCAFRDLFTRGRPLREALCGITGLGELECAEMPERFGGNVEGGKKGGPMDVARKGLGEVKWQMESKILVGKKSGWEDVKLGKMKGRWEKAFVDQS